MFYFYYETLTRLVEMQFQAVQNMPAVGNQYRVWITGSSLWQLPCVTLRKHELRTRNIIQY